MLGAIDFEPRRTGTAGKSSSSSLSGSCRICLSDCENAGVAAVEIDAEGARVRTAACGFEDGAGTVVAARSRAGLLCREAAGAAPAADVGGVLLSGTLVTGAAACPVVVVGGPAALLTDGRWRGSGGRRSGPLSSSSLSSLRMSCSAVSRCAALAVCACFDGIGSPLLLLLAVSAAGCGGRGWSSSSELSARRSSSATDA